jgi:transcriptional regulator with XRE-family HTH domain
MNSTESVARALEAARVLRDHGIGQEQVAKAIGASQSQVSRILAGQVHRPSALLDAVCAYARRLRAPIDIKAVRANDELISALAQTWDGTEKHAKSLAVVIRSLGVLSPQLTD